MHCTRSVTLVAAVVAAVIVSSARRVPAAQHTGASEHTIVGDAFTFAPPRLVVHAGDAVTITFIAKDRPHSFTIDAYRISRRAIPGKNAVIEFCADRRGTFTYYCNLTEDPRCRGMKGELVVQ
jgi:cytochrome c oxidase subunit 2